MPALAFDHVNKMFSLHQGRALLAAHLREAFGGNRGEKDTMHALRDVTFTIEHSESVALIGSNGAGKSTLLSLVAGLASPDGGTVTVEGRIAALLELGSGFHPDLTGEENAIVNAALLGLSRSEAKRMLPQIVEFSGLGDFLDQPARTYSSGMVMRLAFSVAVHVDPDILLIDEVLAVGDQEFQKKCFGKINSFRQQGKTLLFVSHAAEMLKSICQRGIWLEHGQVKMDGPLMEVLEAYQGQVTLPR